MATGGRARRACMVRPGNATRRSRMGMTRPAGSGWDSDRVVAPWCSRLPNITDVVAGSLPAHVNSPAKHELVPHVYVCK